MSTSKQWESRIVEHGMASPEELLANPNNWRVHSKAQQDTLSELLDRVGWVQSIIVNRRTDHVVDGHLRVALALSREEQELPVAYVDLSEEEERLVLATLDPISGMAGTDSEQLLAMIGDLDLDGELRALVDGTAGTLAQLAEGEPPPQPTLAERFGVPPFSVLDARQGYWKDRKRGWLGLGIRSEEGRHPGASDDDGHDRGLLLRASSGRDPRYYYEKQKAEAQLGRELTPAEFESDHYGGYSGDSGGLSGGGTSVFDPVLCELAYRWFCPSDGRVIDPFAGGSVRGILASKLGRRYVGIDLSAQQIAANEQQADELLDAADPRPSWITGDARDLTTHLDDEPFDFAFTCPPYFDLERYSDDPRDLSVADDYPVFLASYEEIIAAMLAALRPDRFAVIVVGDVRDRDGNYLGLVSDTIRAFEKAGAHLYNEAILVTPLGSLPIRAARMFTAGRTLGKTHQNVLVFVKGKAHAAADACGPVEVAVPIEEEGE